MESEPIPINQAEVVSRRRFAVRSIYGLGAVMGLAFSAPAAMYIFTPPGSKHETGWVDAGSTAELHAGTPQQGPVLRVRSDGWEIRTEKESAWVVKNADGSVTAFSPRCTHLGCAYRWEKDAHKFVCPCHGSTFSITGQVVSGPAPRPLDRFQVKIDADRLWLGDMVAADTTKRKT